MKDIVKMHKENVKGHEIVYSKEFVERFKKVLIEVDGYDTYMDLVIIPFLWKKTFMYLPILSYSDRKHNEVDDLLELVKDNDYQIRTLNFEYDDFKKDDTVTMRLNATNIEEICGFFSQKTRHYIRKSKKEGFKSISGNSDEIIENFYELYSETMYEHGTPVFDKKFLYALRDEFRDNMIVFNFYLDDKVVGAACTFVDKDIFVGKWLGIDNAYKDKYLGYYMVYKFIEKGLETKRKIIDFGRSGFESGTYNFKRRFGFYPVKIDIYQPHQEDIYEKYKLAAEIWKKLPKSIADELGPKLSKYLKDL